MRRPRYVIGISESQKNAHCGQLALGDRESELCFPKCSFTQRGHDGLPAIGHELRHANRTLGKIVGVDDVLTKILLGHSLGGDVTNAYLSSEMLRTPVKEAQQKISKSIFELIGEEL